MDYIGLIGVLSGLILAIGGLAALFKVKPESEKLKAEGTATLSQVWTTANDKLFDRMERWIARQEQYTAELEADVERLEACVDVLSAQVRKLGEEPECR